MKKAPRNTIPAIVKFRQKPIINASIQPSSNTLSLETDIMDILPEIVEKIQNNIPLTQSDHHNIIHVMSIKYHCSFRKSLLADAICVEKCKQGNVRVIDKLSSHKLTKSYFVLKGKLIVYGISSQMKTTKIKQKNQGKNKINSSYNSINQPYDITNTNNPYLEEMLRDSARSIPKEQNLNYSSLDAFLKDNQDMNLIETIEELRGYGPLFNSKEIIQSITPKHLLVVAEDAIIIRIKNMEEEITVNNGGMEQQQKIQVLDKFPIFNCLRKKLSLYLQYFQLKKYTHNETIYSYNDAPTHFHLIIVGDVVFHSKINIQVASNKLVVKLKNSVISQLDQNKTKRSSRSNNKPDIIIETETLSSGNYFGEEEIINQSNRNLTAKCGSSSCYILEIPADKFKRLLDYHDFYETIQKSANLRIMQRQSNLSKANQIHTQFNEKSNQQQSNNNDIHCFSQQEKDVIFNRNYTSNTINRQNTDNIITKSKNNKMKVMHGINVTSVEHHHQPSQQTEFSMLRANQQMYESTLKKFRRFQIKPKAKVKPQVNWNLKRIWKVLNLQNILRDDVDANEPQGLKYFEMNRRYINHVNELKSIRPKTSSSTYRTKLQYIAYLQQFNSNTKVNQVI